MLSPEFLLTSLVVALIPGTGVVLTVSTGLFQGWRASIVASFGCTLGIIPHLLASVLGLAAILHLSALAFNVVKFAGVAYLLYLAWATWQDKGLLTFDQTSKGARRNIVVRAFVLNILNPKLSIFFLAFLPQFVLPQQGSVLPQMLLLSLVFMAITFGVFVGYGLLAHSFRALVVNSPSVQTWLKRGFAATFAALGVNLAVSR